MRVIGLTIPGAFSGADAAIFDGLRSRGLLVDVVASEVPRHIQLALLLRTFRLGRRAWGAAWYHALYKTRTAFRSRTAANDARLRNRRDEFDVLLQVSGLYAPYIGTPQKPVALFCDYTTRLAERNYPVWFGLGPDEANSWYALETEVYQRAGVILTGSENTRRSVIQDYGISPDRVRVVGEGIHSVPECSAKTYSERKVLFIGIDFARKGGPTLLQAFRRVRDRVPDAELHIVGPPAMSPQEGVHWHGHVADRGRVRELLDAATVLTLPSICEPFGLALVEGMAHRLPVVGTEVDAMPEIVAHGKTGYLVPRQDPEALADRLAELLLSPALCERFGAEGQKIVRERFLWSHVVDRTESALRELLPAREPATHR